MAETTGIAWTEGKSPEHFRVIRALIERVEYEDGTKLRDIPNWICSGIVLHPSNELQIVSDTEGDEGFATTYEDAVAILVRSYIRDGLLRRFEWK